MSYSVMLYCNRNNVLSYSVTLYRNQNSIVSYSNDILKATNDTLKGPYDSKLNIHIRFTIIIIYEVPTWAYGPGGARGLQPPQILGSPDFLGSERKFGQSQFFKTFPCFLNHYFEEINIFYFNLKLA